MKFVKLVALGDPVEAGMIKELLEGEAIPVSSPGLNHRGMLGMAGSFVDIVIEVPEDRLDEARELLDQVRGDVAGDTPDDRDEGQGRSVPDSPRKKRVAAFCALAMTFGCGHFYARSYRMGALLLAAEATALVLLFNGVGSVVLGLPFLMAADLFGSFVAVDRFNGVERADLWARATPLFVLLAVGVAVHVPVTYAVAPERLVSEDDADVCEYRERCLGVSRAECRQDVARARLDRATWRENPNLHDCAHCVSRVDACAESSRCSDECEFVTPVVAETTARSPGPGPFTF